MENVTKVYFDPLLRQRADIETLLRSLPIGSAHAFDRTLLVHSLEGVITAIDVSMHGEDYFSNAVNLADLGEDVLDRMKQFSQISTFNNHYSIQQAPSSTFKVPIHDNEIHIFAVSQRTPSYYDLCLGTAQSQTACWCARSTFAGITHSGDNNSGNTLLQHMRFVAGAMDELPRTVFVSGYDYNKLRNYKAYNPLVLVANHKAKALYIIPVPLDAATIGDGTICCPLVIKKDPTDNTLLCSVLASAATEEEKMCTGNTFRSEALPTAIRRADFNLTVANTQPPVLPSETQDTTTTSVVTYNDIGKDIIIATYGATPSSIFLQETTQIVRFGKGLQWSTGETTSHEESLTVLPCIFGGLLEGPMLLATGQLPVGIPFQTGQDLRGYYEEAESIVVIVDDNMTDNARNLASNYRLNGLFILQKIGENPGDTVDVTPILDKVNINAITALAGPQSLVLVQLGTKFYFYRGLANPTVLDTSSYKFGQDVTEIINEVSKKSLFQDVVWPTIVDLLQENPVYLPKTKQAWRIEQLTETFETSSLEDIGKFKDDIVTMIPQLQALLSEDKLQELSAGLIRLLESKVSVEIGPLKREYASFITKEYDSSDPESWKRKAKLLGELRKLDKKLKDEVEWLTQLIGGMISTQTSSTRVHDLKRLVRQNTIKNNVDAAKAMSFEDLAGLLETHASKMGVLLVNINEPSYILCLQQGSEGLLGGTASSDICKLDSRTLYLEGLDAGIILEQAQENHVGPLRSQSGPKHAIMALANLDKQLTDGSMLAWACWDEFVELKNPYTVRWMEKCNDSHIAALRIITRGTISNAVSTRKINLTAQSPFTGQLMAHLLMTSMSQLAATRSTPSTTLKSDDTTTLLMRGLFGNFLTIAGSGAKPMSFVWQLFGTVPQLDIPQGHEWIWYEKAASLIPYTGWSITQFKKNLIALLDKIIFRMISKNEPSDLAQRKVATLKDYCKARNIQLLHSRTVITILKQMLTGQSQCQDAAVRLLEVIPSTVENETESYRRLHRYIVHLAAGGKQRSHDNLLAANVFTKRSACFSKLKTELSNAVRTDNKDETVKLCLEILAERASIEKTWGLDENTVHMQGLAHIKDVLAALSQPSDDGKATNLEKALRMKALGDNEQKRVAWQIGKGQYGTIEALDEDVLNQVLYGKDKTETVPKDVAADDPDTFMAVQDEFELCAHLAKAGFVKSVQAVKSVQSICNMLEIPESSMRVFAKMLAPDFNLDEELASSFKTLVLSLVQDRNRDAKVVRPTEKLLGMVGKVSEAVLLLKAWKVVDVA